MQPSGMPPMDSITAILQAANAADVKLTTYFSFITPISRIDP